MKGACALSEENIVEIVVEMATEIAEQGDPPLIEEHHCIEDGNSAANSPDEISDRSTDQTITCLPPYKEISHAAFKWSDTMSGDDFTQAITAAYTEGSQAFTHSIRKGWQAVYG